MKKYYLKSYGHGIVKGYLNYNGKFYISTKDETPWTKTRFTDEEIARIELLYPEDFKKFKLIEVE